MSISHAQAVASIQGLQSIDGRSVQPSDALGCMLLALRLEESTSQWAPTLKKVLDKIQKDLPMMTESDAWSGLWREGPLLERDFIKPNSAQFMRDCLQNGDKSPEPGADSPWGRVSHDIIWLRHWLELKTKAYLAYCKDKRAKKEKPVPFTKFPLPSPKKGSSILTRDEAKYYLKYSALPQNLRRA